MQTREQEYAEIIFGQVNDFKDAAHNRHKDKPQQAKQEIDQYGSMAHQLPVLVRTAGLAQALTFVEARGKPAHKQLLDDLALVFDKETREKLAAAKQEANKQEANKPEPLPSPGAKLAAAARTSDLPAYMRLTQQVLAALIWYKRFAQSVLDVESGDKGGQ